jgi:hypothetical protein
MLGFHLLVDSACGGNDVHGWVFSTNLLDLAEDTFRINSVPNVLETIDVQAGSEAAYPVVAIACSFSRDDGGARSRGATGRAA